MNYRGYLPTEERRALEEQDLRASNESWLAVCEARYADALKTRSRIQKAARLADLIAARRAVRS